MRKLSIGKNYREDEEFHYNSQVTGITDVMVLFFIGGVKFD